MTIQNDGLVAEAIEQTPAEIGFTSDLNNIQRIPHFLDYPFTKPDITFKDHLAAAKRLNPKIAVAPDIEKGLSLEEGIYQADLLLDHAEVVVVVPKSVHPTKVPDRFRVGLTMANFGSNAPWLLWDYRNCQSIHVLGGSPDRQMLAITHGLQVDSLDGFSLGVQAQFGMWDNKCTDAPNGWDYQRRLIESIKNYCDVLQQL